MRTKFFLVAFILLFHPVCFVSVSSPAAPKGTIYPEDQVRVAYEGSSPFYVECHPHFTRMLTEKPILQNLAASGESLVKLPFAIEG